ncbi:MAG: sigma 54-interacting transcriptional regulator [Acidobacteria bacterium]|nr:sigma 54-interacting transcriptional regulator [Acidobacteriota bacterium]
MPKFQIHPLHQLHAGNEEILSELTVLVRDRQPERSRLVSTLITAGGAWPVPLASHFATALPDQCAIAVLDLGAPPVPDGSTAELMKRLKARGYSIIAYENGTSAWPIGLRCQALLWGASWIFDSAQPDFAQKFSDSLTRLLQETALRQADERNWKQEMKRLGLVGESQAMISVFQSAARAAALSDLTTLITGETGTGKELIARAIHQLDPKRRNGPFIAVNCSAINAGVAESEWFGHRRGAFTGAERDRSGLIRAAHKGVLFLDEIGEMELALQAKLLRVLQESRVLGVGEDREHSVDVRVIAATNRDLKASVQTGHFRADLFHRLNLLSLHLPSLRQRLTDLPALVEHFLEKHGTAASYRIGSDFLAALALVELPGNVRQLENVVRWAMANKCDEIPLNLSDLPRELLEQLAECSAARPAVPPSSANPCHSIATLTTDDTDDRPPTELQGCLTQLLRAQGWTLAQSLDCCEKILLESALQLTHGNQTQTAKLLGLTPRSVYNKVRHHHLPH